MSRNVARVKKLVEVAGHATTGDSEALNALRLARALAEKEGKAIADVLMDGHGNPNDPLDSVVMDLSYDEFQQRMTVLELALRSAQKGYDRFQAQMDRSMLRIESKNAAEKGRMIDKGRNADGTMPWGAFDVKLTAISGQRNGSMSAFSRHMGITLAVITQWRKNGVVPVEAVESLKTFKDTVKVEREQDALEWTFAMEEELMALSEKHSDNQMAEILSKTWNKPVTFGGVKKARQRGRAMRETLRIYDTGVFDVTEISRHLAKEFGPNFGGVTTNRVQQVIDHYRATVVVPIQTPDTATV